MSAKKKLLITGGAGYIGSHMLLQLKNSNYDLVILDNLSTGHPANLIAGEFILGCIQDYDFLIELFAKHRFDGIIHLAASTSVPESSRIPQQYFQNNTVGTLNLIKACVNFGVTRFLFSSTAAVYGIQSDGIAAEDTPPAPINAYGKSKWMAEQIIQECAKVHGITYAILRYFNVAGVDYSNSVGPYSNSMHLIKAIINTALGKQEFLSIYGNDYPTPDGTGVRDFIHINDLISAHLLVVNYLFDHKTSLLLNCGYGHGYSVLEVVKAAACILGKKIPFKIVDRRPGDCAQMIAKPDRIKKILHWEPKFDNLEFMIESLWEWEIAQNRKKNMLIDPHAKLLPIS